MNKVKFKNLSAPLKNGIIGGYVYLVLTCVAFVIGLFIGFMG